MAEPLTFRLKALTDIWTGGLDQQCDRLHETGLIGSLRWWYEALVRGLGGFACDPVEDKCEYVSKVGQQSVCAACYSFGTTGWARKFRLRVLDRGGNLIQGRIRTTADITLEFLELRAMDDAEKWLLRKAVQTGATYGAFGGKTTSLRESRGLLELTNPIGKLGLDRDEVRDWLRRFRQAKNKPEWADLRRFVFVGKKALAEDPRAPARRLDPDFLLGQRQPEKSRKIFVFRNPDRTFAYFRDDSTYEKVLAEWTSIFGRANVKTGEEVIREL